MCGLGKVLEVDSDDAYTRVNTLNPTELSAIEMAKMVNFIDTVCS